MGLLIPIRAPPAAKKYLIWTRCSTTIAACSPMLVVSATSMQISVVHQLNFWWNKQWMGHNVKMMSVTVVVVVVETWVHFLANFLFTLLILLFSRSGPPSSRQNTRRRTGRQQRNPGCWRSSNQENTDNNSAIDVEMDSLQQGLEMMDLGNRPSNLCCEPMEYQHNHKLVMYSSALILWLIYI